MVSFGLDVVVAFGCVQHLHDVQVVIGGPVGNCQADENILVGKGVGGDDEMLAEMVVQAEAHLII